MSNSNGRLMQVIHEPGVFELPVVDLRAHPPSQRVVEALRLATDQARQPFDFEKGPLLRTMLIQLDDDYHKLFLVLHHIAFDCASVYTVLLPELARLYAERGGEPHDEARSAGDGDAASEDQESQERRERDAAAQAEAAQERYRSQAIPPGEASEPDHR